MYTAKLDPVRYADPWQVSLDERLRRLVAGSPRIAYYYAQPDSSTFRYRALNMIEALEIAEPGASAAWFTAGDGLAASDAIEKADVLVVCRALYTQHIAAVIARARAAKKRILFDVDDLVFDHRYAHLVMETLDQTVDEDGLQFWFGRIARLEATLRLCDEAITTNAFLADRIRDVHDVPTHVVPNFLNREQLEVSNEVLEAKEKSRFARDTRIHLGYFSGTPSHNRDFRIVDHAIADLMDDDPRVHLRIVGFVPPSDVVERHHRRVQLLPLQDFLNLQRTIGETELNLIPLQDNVFANCKSELKYFEAAVVGTVSIASPTFALRGAIRHGENGFLTPAQGWTATLAEVAETCDFEGIGRAAAADAISRYSPESQAAVLRRVFFAEP